MELVVRTQDLINISQAAIQLGVSRPTVYNFVRRNQLHPLIIGGRKYLFRNEVSSLESFLWNKKKGRK